MMANENGGGTENCGAGGGDGDGDETGHGWVKHEGCHTDVVFHGVLGLIDLDLDLIHSSFGRHDEVV